MPDWFNIKRVALLTVEGALIILLWLYLIFIKASIYAFVGGLVVTVVLILIMLIPTFLDYLKEEKEFDEQERRSTDRYNQEQGELNDLNKWSKK